MTSFRRLKSKIGVRSICRSNDLEPSPDLAKDGRHVMTRTMFCGLNPCQPCSKTPGLANILTLRNIQNPVQAIMKLPKLVKAGTHEGTPPG